MKETAEVQGWGYYNHAMVPTCAPHEEPDLTPIQDGSIWKVHKGGTPVLARWTTDWDCGYETEWWYTILDKPFDIMSLDSSSRRRITRGLKNFDCRRIDPSAYADEMAYVAQADYAQYPKKYRPHYTMQELADGFRAWSLMTHGAFDHEGMLCAFHGIADCGNYYLMVQGKSIPEKQRGQLNAALIYTYITDLGQDIQSGKYLTNGQRNLNHETNFNEDLCRYYGFRKAYCKLHIAYNPKYKWIIYIAYPFRAVLRKLDGIGLVHKLNAILKMEEIVRKQT